MLIVAYHFSFAQVNTAFTADRHIPLTVLAESVCIKNIAPVEKVFLCDAICDVVFQEFAKIHDNQALALAFVAHEPRLHSVVHVVVP